METLVAHVVGSWGAFMAIPHIDAVLFILVGTALFGGIHYGPQAFGGTIDAPPPGLPTNNDVVEGEQKTLDDILTNVELPVPLSPAPNVPVPSIWGHPNTVSYTPSKPWNQALTLRAKNDTTQASPWPAFMILAIVLFLVAYLARLIYKCCCGCRNNAAAATNNDSPAEDPFTTAPQNSVQQAPAPPVTPSNLTQNVAPPSLRGEIRPILSPTATKPWDYQRTEWHKRFVGGEDAQIRKLTRTPYGRSLTPPSSQGIKLQQKLDESRRINAAGLAVRESLDARVGVLEQLLEDSQNELESLRTQLDQANQWTSDSESATSTGSENERVRKLQEERDVAQDAAAELARERDDVHTQVETRRKQDREETTALNTRLRKLEEARTLPDSDIESAERIRNLQQVTQELTDQVEIARKRADEDVNTIALLQSALNGKDDEFEAKHKNLKDKLRAYEQKEDNTPDDDQMDHQFSEAGADALLAAQQEVEQYKQKNLAFQVHDLGCRLEQQQNKEAPELQARDKGIERLQVENSQLQKSLKDARSMDQPGSTQSDLEARYRALETDKKHLEDRIKARDDRIEALEQQVAGLSDAQNKMNSEAARADLQRRIDDTTGEVRRLTNEASATNSNTRKLEETIQDLKKQLSETKKNLHDCNSAQQEWVSQVQFAEATARAEATEKNHSASQGEIKKLKEQLKSCNDDCDKLCEGETDCKCNGEDLDRAKETIKTQRAEIENLRQEVYDREDDLDGTKAHVKGLNEGTRNLEFDNERLTNQHDEDEERIESLEGQLSARNIQLDVAEQQLRETKAKLETCKNKQKQQTGEAEYAGALQQENANLRAEIEALRKEVDDRQGKLDDCESRSKRQLEQLKDTATVQRENTTLKAQLKTGNAEPTETTKSTPAAEPETTVESEGHHIAEETSQEPETTTGETQGDAAADSLSMKERQDDTTAIVTAAELQGSDGNEDTSQKSKSVTDATHGQRPAESTGSNDDVSTTDDPNVSSIDILGANELPKSLSAPTSSTERPSGISDIASPGDPSFSTSPVTPSIRIVQNSVLLPSSPQFQTSTPPFSRMSESIYASATPDENTSQEQHKSQQMVNRPTPKSPQPPKGPAGKHKCSTCHATFADTPKWNFAEHHERQCAKWRKYWEPMSFLEPEKNQRRVIKEPPQWKHGQKTVSSPDWLVIARNKQAAFNEGVRQAGLANNWGINPQSALFAPSAQASPSTLFNPQAASFSPFTLPSAPFTPSAQALPFTSSTQAPPSIPPAQAQTSTPTAQTPIIPPLAPIAASGSKQVLPSKSETPSSIKDGDMGETKAKPKEEVTQSAIPTARTKDTSSEGNTAGPQKAPVPVDSGDSSLPESNAESGKVGYQAKKEDQQAQGATEGVAKEASVANGVTDAIQAKASSEQDGRPQPEGEPDMKQEQRRKPPPQPINTTFSPDTPTSFDFYRMSGGPNSATALSFAGLSTRSTGNTPAASPTQTPTSAAQSQSSESTTNAQRRQQHGNRRLYRAGGRKGRR